MAAIREEYPPRICCRGISAEWDCSWQRLNGPISLLLHKQILYVRMTLKETHPCPGVKCFNCNMAPFIPCPLTAHPMKHFRSVVTLFIPEMVLHPIPSQQDAPSRTEKTKNVPQVSLKWLKKTPLTWEPLLVAEEEDLGLLIFLNLWDRNRWRSLANNERHA